MKIIQATGGTCNQLWIYLNLFSDALESRRGFAIWVPDIQFINFPNLLNFEFIYYPLINKRVFQIIGPAKYIKIIDFIFNNKYSLHFFKQIFSLQSSHEFIVVDVSNMKKCPSLKKNFQTVFKLFDFSESLKKSNSNKIYKTSDQIFVGLHMRLGDYKYYNNGQYFYSVEYYLQLAHHIVKLFKAYKVKFIIVSDEKIDFTKFDSFDYIISESKKMHDDLYLLSKSDFIVGPPSTFSAWASLYKNSKIYFISNMNVEFKVIDFFDIKDIWIMS